MTTPGWGRIPIFFPITALSRRPRSYSFTASRACPICGAVAIVSLVAVALSALFNWYAMRRGTLLVGEEGTGFGSYLRRLPGLLFTFFALLPRTIAGKLPASPTVLLNSRPAVPR